MLKRTFLITVLAVIFLIGIVFIFYPRVSNEGIVIEHLTELPGITEQEEISTEPDLTESNLTESRTPHETASIQQQINLLIIPKIGVRMPIVEGNDESALNRGAWRLPETSTPDKGGNTALTGHRWLYRPPSQKTFYLLDKLEIGDSFQILWLGKTYNYKVVSTFVVEPTQVDVLNPTSVPTVTLITCTPLFSVEKRLIVRGEMEGK